MPDAEYRRCSVEGCERRHYGRGVCKPHYRKLPDQRARDRQYEKTKRATPTRLEQERQRNHRRRGYIDAWAEAHKDWGAWWERHRYYEDRRELRHWKPRVWPQCQVIHHPKPRLFISRRCQACDAMWVSYAAMPDTDLCSSCNKQRWGGTHRQRARRYGIPYAHINPHDVFNRDGWRCQLCGKKTRGRFPEPRSPTLDHIIPLAAGGLHTMENLQCACLRCNSSKGAGAANDQLLLAI